LDCTLLSFKLYPMPFKESKNPFIISKSLALYKRLSKITLPIEIRLVANDFWVMLFICCISLFVHKLFFSVFIYLIFKIRKVDKKADLREIYEPPKEVEQLILFIHMNHLQSLTEAIESNPQLLYCDYKKKSLVHWCKHYNNTKAILVIHQMSQKYPKEALRAA
jgi:hypothetical protein